MADKKNDTAAPKAENKAETAAPPPPPSAPPPPPKGFWNSAFWKSPFGTALLIAVVAFVLPMDEIMSEIVEPTLGLADKVRRLLMIRIERAARNLRRAAGRQFWAALTIAIICATITFIGVAAHIRVVAALGPAIWGAYLIWLRIKIGTSVSVLSYVAGTGIELSGTLLGKLLRSAGIRVEQIGVKVGEKGKSLADAIGKSLVLMSVFSFSAGGLLFLAPNWLSLGLFLGAFITVGATGTAAVYLGKSVHVGIEFIYRWSYRLVIVEIIYGLLLALLPKTMGSMGDRVSAFDNWLDALHADPSSVSIGPVTILVGVGLLVGLAYFLSGWYSKTDEGKSKAYAVAGKGLFIALLVLPVVMLFTGTIPWPGVKHVAIKSWYGQEYTIPDHTAPAQTQVTTSPPAPVTGQPNDLEAPTDARIPANVAPTPTVKAPAPPAPDSNPVDTARSLNGQTDIELLSE